MVFTCRCHGLSGTCNLKTCWATVPSIEKVGDYLRTKYSKSIYLPSAVEVNKLIPLMNKNDVVSILVNDAHSNIDDKTQYYSRQLKSLDHLSRFQQSPASIFPIDILQNDEPKPDLDTQEKVPSLVVPPSVDDTKPSKNQQDLRPDKFKLTNLATTTTTAVPNSISTQSNDENQQSAISHLVNPTSRLQTIKNNKLNPFIQKSTTINPILSFSSQTTTSTSTSDPSSVTLSTVQPAAISSPFTTPKPVVLNSDNLVASRNLEFGEAVDMPLPSAFPSNLVTNIQDKDDEDIEDETVDNVAPSVTPMSDKEFATLLKGMKLCDRSNLKPKRRSREHYSSKYHEKSHSTKKNSSSYKDMVLIHNYISNLLSSNKEDLVYLHKSPSYCSLEPRIGIFGVTSRSCIPDGSGPDSCDKLCCDQGFRERVYNVTETKCKFEYCCEVTCRPETTEIRDHACN